MVYVTGVHSDCVEERTQSCHEQSFLLHLNIGLVLVSLFSDEPNLNLFPINSIQISELHIFLLMLFSILLLQMHTISGFYFNKIEEKLNDLNELAFFYISALKPLAQKAKSRSIDLRPIFLVPTL